MLRGAVDRGRMDGGLRFEGVSMVFKRTAAQEADIEKLLAEQQDPSSANYHKWLTPEQYADRFGLSTADVAAVTSWLQAQGFTVNRVARARTQIWFSGPIAGIETVFRTEMHRYSVNGESHFANGTELAVPSALANVVLGFGNLDDFRPKPNVKVRRVKADFTSSISGGHFMAPDDFATIYDVKALYTAGFDGTGQKLVVVGQSELFLTGTPAIPSDIDAFRAPTAANLPARTSSNFVRTLVPGSGTATVVQGDVDESSIDLEWAEGVAKGVTEIFVYTGNNQNFGVFEALQYAIDNNLAPVISISYGACEATATTAQLQSMQQVTQQAVIQGQTISAASGDNGAAGCETASALPATGGLTVDVPSSLPYVTSVGGTAFSGDVSSPSTYWSATNDANGGSAIKYIPETSWNDTAAAGVLSSGGGGASSFFSKPSWQTGTGVPSDGARDTPDIAFDASPNQDPFLLCSQGSCVNGFRRADTTLNIAGGTSFGAPAFAGILAILNQATHSSGQGNVNPTLYSLAATQGVFHDITSGTNIVPCGAGSPDCPSSLTYGYSAGVGYDLVTGLGTIDANNLVTNWSSGNPTAADFSLFAETVGISAPGGQGTSTITVDGRNGFAGSVTFTCTAPASALITCSMSGSPVSLSAGTPSGSATLTVVTKATAALEPHNAPLWLTGSGALFAGVFVFGIPARRRRWTVAFTLLVFALVAAAVGCSGSSGSTTTKSAGTPVGTYNVTVTGTVTGTTTTTHTTNVAVQVL